MTADGSHITQVQVQYQAAPNWHVGLKKWKNPSGLKTLSLPTNSYVLFTIKGVYNGPAGTTGMLCFTDLSGTEHAVTLMPGVAGTLKSPVFDHITTSGDHHFWVGLFGPNGEIQSMNVDVVTA